jgi:hypothetical protein
MRVRVCTESGRTTKILFVDNPIQISVIANKYDYWEYM